MSSDGRRATTQCDEPVLNEQAPWNLPRKRLSNEHASLIQVQESMSNASVTPWPGIATSGGNHRPHSPEATVGRRHESELSSYESQPPFWRAYRASPE
jgi:hypothetical protein